MPRDKSSQTFPSHFLSLIQTFLYVSLYMIYYVLVYKLFTNI